MSADAASRPTLSRRSEPLPFARPDITEAEIDAVVDTLRSGWLTTGPRVKEFEDALAAYVGARHAVALNSGTAALHLALVAIDLSPDDEVVVPTYTFTATAEVVRYFGARPVLVDVRADDLNIDVDAVERAITSRTRAVIGVDVGGAPCDWPRLRELASRHGLVLIDDAAHALPTRLDKRLIGTWADITAFSFYVTKTLTTGEGGMLVTDNQAWADRARSMSLHGISQNAWKRYEGLGSWQYEVHDAGFKYNMTDIAAAMGLVQLRRLDEMCARRVEIARRYSDAFAKVSALQAPHGRDGAESSWHLYLLRLDLDGLAVDRAAFIRRLATENIGSSVHFIPLHMHPYYRDSLGVTPEQFPVATSEFNRVVSLPIYSRMTDADAADVIAAVQAIVKGAPVIRG
jgi:dTDP-4-amino-4,6-dideoxygalactose transaminase